MDRFLSRFGGNENINRCGWRYWFLFFLERKYIVFYKIVILRICYKGNFNEKK